MQLVSSTQQPAKSKSLSLPNFDMHKVEQALRENHKMFEGRAWSEQEIKEAILAYRIFLRDHKAAGQPERFTYPGQKVDRVWHTHMVQTREYARDCQAYFGQMFHHAHEICEGGVDP